MHLSAPDLTSLQQLRSPWSPKIRLAPLPSVVNAAARLIARLPRFFHITTFMARELHWVLFSALIQFKIPILVSKAQLGLAPSYMIPRREGSYITISCF